MILESLATVRPIYAEVNYKGKNSRRFTGKLLQGALWVVNGEKRFYLCDELSKLVNENSTRIFCFHVTLKFDTLYRSY